MFVVFPGQLLKGANVTSIDVECFSSEHFCDVKQVFVLVVDDDEENCWSHSLHGQDLLALVTCDVCEPRLMPVVTDLDESNEMWAKLL